MIVLEGILVVVQLVALGFIYSLRERFNFGAQVMRTAAIHIEEQNRIIENLRAANSSLLGEVQRLRSVETGPATSSLVAEVPPPAQS